MIKISFIVRKGEPKGFNICGHSGYAEAGSDIVCAAVSSAVRYAECIMNDVMGLNIPFEVNDRNASITMRLCDNLPLEGYECCKKLLKGMYLYFTQLQQEFPENIDVLEV